MVRGGRLTAAPCCVHFALCCAHDSSTCFSVELVHYACNEAFPLRCGHGLGTDVRTQRFTWHECHFELFALVVSDAIVTHTYVYRAGFNGLSFGESDRILIVK